MKRSGMVVGVLLGCLWADGVLAQEPLAGERAIEKAIEAYERDEFERCANLFLGLFEQTEEPSLLVNAATCQYDGDDDAQARRTLLRVLEFEPPAPEVVRARATHLLALVDAAIARDAPPPAPAAAAEPTSGAVPLPTYVLGGVALVGAGVSTALGIAALNSWSDAKAACPGRSFCPDDRGHERSADARRQGALATTGFALSAVAAAGAVVFWWTGTAREATNSLSITAAPGGLGLRLTGSL